ncbi:MAG: hypothetical protein ACLVD8_27415 [Enterocloster sp.]|uniref:hypothetical protein n=1 Tax=Enterocloster sp. TaxID=2719315 RepID=UPI00399B8D5E
MGNHVNLDVTTKITDPCRKEEFVNKAQMFIDGTPLYQVSASSGIDKGASWRRGMEYSGSTAPACRVYTILSE